MNENGSIREYDFPSPNDETGYNIFPADLEADPLVAFHGTAESNLVSIIAHGFKIQGILPSISFAKNSGFPLGLACNKRSNDSPRGVVIAVRFDSLSGPCIKEEVSCIYLFCEDKQPKIVGYCIVPEHYEHR